MGRSDKKWDISERYWAIWGASGDIELIEVFSILLRDAHENTYFKHPVNVHQPHPQKNMGWDKHVFKVEASSCFSKVMYFHEFGRFGESKLFSIYNSVEFESLFQMAVSQNSFQHLFNIEMSDT